jgi:hypothetical protein
MQHTEPPKNAFPAEQAHDGALRKALSARELRPVMHVDTETDFGISQGLMSGRHHPAEGVRVTIIRSRGFPGSYCEVMPCL